jgi:hypothetical protein
MRRILLALLVLTAGLLAPVALLHADPSSSDDTAQEYRAGEDRSKAFVPSRAKKLIAQLRQQGAKQGHDLVTR